MPDTIIFDFDGTLIDSAPGILATYAAVLADAGITPAATLDATLVGPPLQITMEKIAGPVGQPRLLALIEDFKRLYGSIGVANTPAYADAASTLSALRARGYTLYLATNKRAAPTLTLIEKFAWQTHFRRLYCIDAHQPAFNDKTAMLRQLLRDSNLSAEQCVYVGDTRGDYLSANACGIRFIAALWGYEDWQALSDREKMLTHACSSLAEFNVLMK